MSKKCSFPCPATAIPGCCPARPCMRGNRRLVTEPGAESCFSSSGTSVCSKPRGMQTAQRGTAAPAAHSLKEAHWGTAGTDPAQRGGSCQLVLSQGQSCIFRLGNERGCFGVVLGERQETITQQLCSISPRLSLNCTFASAPTCRVVARRKVKWGCLSGRYPRDLHHC